MIQVQQNIKGRPLSHIMAFKYPQPGQASGSGSACVAVGPWRASACTWFQTEYNIHSMRRRESQIDGKNMELEARESPCRRRCCGPLSALRAAQTSSEGLCNTQFLHASIHPVSTCQTESCFRSSWKNCEKRSSGLRHPRQQSDS
jgi:hypothetical protein